MIGETIEDYRIIESLGQGSMGQVFRGIDIMLNREVAVKLFHQHLIPDRSTLQLFRAEAVTQAKLFHPNVALLYDFFEHQGSYLVVTEYIKGESIENIIKRAGAFQLKNAIKVFCQILRGFEYAHSKRVLHYSVKPGNLIIDTEGIVKITDFAVARVWELRGLKKEEKPVAKAEYLSPEQLKGQKVDERSDIYSLGAVLYEMLTGCMPFNGEAVELPKEIKEVIQRATAKEPEARFQTVREFRLALESSFESLPVKRTGLVRSVLRPATIVPALMLAASITVTGLAIKLLSPTNETSAKRIEPDEKSTTVIPLPDDTPKVKIVQDNEIEHEAGIKPSTPIRRPVHTDRQVRLQQNYSRPVPKKVVAMPVRAIPYRKESRERAVLIAKRGETKREEFKIEPIKREEKRVIIKTPPIDRRPSYDVTEFLNAAWNGDRDKMKRLLNSGVDVNARDEMGRTALIIAASRGHDDACKFLLDRGALVNAKDINGKTALMGAMEGGHGDTAKALLRRGANMNLRDLDGRTAQMRAESKGQYKMLNWLAQN